MSIVKSRKGNNIEWKKGRRERPQRGKSGDETLGPFLDANAGDVLLVNIDNDLYEGALDVLERLRERFVVGTRLHFHELVEFQRGRCGDDMKCVRPDQEMRALYRFLRRHPCIGLALDPVRGGRPRAQPVVFVVARTECE